jgi:sugar phosphate permease
LESRRGTIVLAMLWLSYFGLYLNRRNVSAVLPALMADMHLNHTEAGLLITAFFVAYALLQVPSGWLADRLGGRVVILCGNVVTVLSGLVSGLSASYPVMLLSRIAGGAGQSASWPSSTKLTAEWFSDRIGLAMGVLSTSVSVGSSAALVLAGYLLHLYDWRAAFFAPSAVLAALTVGILVFVRDKPRAENPPTHARSGAHAFSRSVFKDTTMRKYAVSYLFWKYGFEGIFYWLPAFLVETFGVSIEEASGVAGAILFTGLISSPIGGWICDRVGRREHVVALSLAPTTLLMTLLSSTRDFSHAAWLILVIGVLFQLSGGVYFVIPSDRLGPDKTGMGTGFINFGGQIGTFLSPWITGLLVDAYHSYSPALLTFALTAALGIAVTLIPEKSGEPSTPI